MTNSALILPITAFNELTPSAQQEILSAMSFHDIRQVNTTASAATQNPIDNDGPDELTLIFVRKLTKNLSDKTLNALKVIAQSDTPRFHMKDVIDATAGAKNYMDVRSIWSALTRRTRKILDDREADLIWWTKGDNANDDDNDWVGSIAPLTHKSLKTYFGV